MNYLLSKSNFKLASDCLTKLYYANRPNEYPNSNTVDPFLAGLADGGFQVGAMAKDLYPNGIDIDKTWSNDKAVEETKELLKKDEVIIYEGAFESNGCIIRTDILEQIGNTLELTEVKSKSYSQSVGFRTKKGDIRSEYMEYLIDVAFQTYVLRSAFPNKNIIPYLYLVNKDEICNDNFLNQRYMINKDDVRTKVVINEEIPSPKDELLIRIDCSLEVEELINDYSFEYDNESYSFKRFVELAKDVIINGFKPISCISSLCKDCEFKNGFNDCWKDKIDLDSPLTWDINGLHHTKKAKMLKAEQFEMASLTDEIIEDYKLNPRQVTQIQLTLESNISKKVEMEVLTDALKLEIDKYEYPLHFIDFETIAPAIPMNKGLKPYEQVLFQYSHHVMYEDGTVEHKTEYINTVKGFSPSIKAVRELKKALENDNGTIFRYHNHENTVLVAIKNQIETLIANDLEENDFLDIIDFINSITTQNVMVFDKVKGKLKKGKDIGTRNMVDLCELVKKYYISTIMGGSNSIKYVLPSVLNTSKYIQEKYSKPIYNGKNFTDKVWIQKDEKGAIMNPYDLLGGEAIKNGGDAMYGYAQIQYVNSSNEYVKQLSNELLAYCEVDTFAMVLIFEHFLELVGYTDRLK